MERQNFRVDALSSLSLSAFCGEKFVFPIFKPEAEKKRARPCPEKLFYSF
jgi:hypothetical protein